MVMKLVSASMLALLLCVFTLPGVTSFTASGASLLARPCPLSFSPSSPRSPTLRTASAISMAAVKKSKLAKTLNKKTLTVSVDVAAGDAMLSKRLRTTGVATIFADAGSWRCVCYAMPGLTQCLAQPSCRCLQRSSRQLRATSRNLRYPAAFPPFRIRR